MTIFLPSSNDELSQEEWQELFSLKKAIDDSPASMATNKLERFSALFVRSLHGKGDTMRQ
jgi:hypothetical protein